MKTCGELGIYSEMLTPPETITTEEMLKLVADLNSREEIDGILIQLPLPAHVDTKRLLEAVDPAKDVDGFHPVNVGRLQSGTGSACSMHTCRDHRDSEAQRDCDCRQKCGCRRPLGHRRQARGDDVVECLGDRDGMS